MKGFVNILLMFFCLMFTLSAQSGLEDDPVVEMFDKPQKVEWVKHYKGRLNDMNDVAVTLAKEGKNVKGELQYLRSKAVFYLAGELKKDKLILQEYDLAGQISGYISGEFFNQGLRGSWQNTGNTLGANIRLKEVKNRVDVPTYCGNNKWIRFYTGQLGRDKTRMVLQKNSGAHISGTLNIFNKNGTQNLKGYTDIFDNIYLTIKDEMARPQGKLEGTFDDQKKFNANYIKKNGKEISCTFHLNKTLPMACQEYADYTSDFDVLYPKTQNESFNKWIENIMQVWEADCKKYTEKKSEMIQVPTPVMRKSLRAYGWSDVDIYTDDFISGQLHFFTSWKERPTSRNLNFNFKTGKEILASDIFKSDFNYADYAKKYLINRLLQHKLSKDEVFKKWLSQQSFSAFNFRHEGVYFATDFHPLYGRQSITIPYKKLKPFFTKNNIIQNLLKGKY